MINRRAFLRMIGVVGAYGAIAGLPIKALADLENQVPTLNGFGIAAKKTAAQLTRATKTASAAVEQLREVIANGIQEELDGKGWHGIDSFSDHFESDDGTVMVWTTIASTGAAQDGRTLDRS